MSELRNIFKYHQEQLLLVLSLIFIVVIFAVYSWGLRTIGEDINKMAQASDQSAKPIDFNISQAKQIDFKGLTPQ